MATDAEAHVWEDGGDLVLILPGGTREYVIADVDAEVGLEVQRNAEKARRAKRRHDAGESVEDIDADLHLSDDAESALYTNLLGPTLDDLKADGVKWKQVQLAGRIAYAWVAYGVEAARKMWEARGEAPKANREQRRATTRASGSKPRTGGAAAKRTSSATGRGTSRRT